MSARKSLAVIPSALIEACRTFEDSVGGRTALISALATSPLNDAQEQLVRALADPRNDEASLAKVCQTFSVPLSELFLLFRNAGLARAQLLSMLKVWEGLPAVAGDLMTRAVPHYVPCHSCHGTKVQVEGMPALAPDGSPLKDEAGWPVLLQREVPCEACRGAGEVLQQPKLETQKVALEMGGVLVPKGQAVQVNVTQQQAAFGGGFAAGFYKQSDRVLYPALPGEEPEEGEAEAESATDDVPVDAEILEEG